MPLPTENFSAPAPVMGPCRSNTPPTKYGLTTELALSTCSVAPLAILMPPLTVELYTLKPRNVPLAV